MFLNFLGYILLGVFLSAASIKLMLKFTKSTYGLQDYAYDDYKLHMKFQSIGTFIVFLVGIVIGTIQLLVAGVPKAIAAVFSNPKGFFVDLAQVVLWPFSIPYYLNKVYDNEMIELLSMSIKRTNREVGIVDLRAFLIGKRLKSEGF